MLLIHELVLVDCELEDLQTHQFIKILSLGLCGDSIRNLIEVCNAHGVGQSNNVLLFKDVLTDLENASLLNDYQNGNVISMTASAKRYKLTANCLLKNNEGFDVPYQAVLGNIELDFSHSQMDGKGNNKVFSNVIGKLFPSKEYSLTPLH